MSKIEEFRASSKKLLEDIDEYQSRPGPILADDLLRGLAAVVDLVVTAIAPEKKALSLVLKGFAKFISAMAKGGEK